MLCERNVRSRRALRPFTLLSLDFTDIFHSQGVTNAANVDPFFGAIPLNAERTKFTWVPERFAPKWFRSGEAYGLKLVLQDILETYLLHPEMLVFGGNREGKFVELEMVTPRSVDGLGCFLCELAEGRSVTKSFR